MDWDRMRKEWQSRPTPARDASTSRPSDVVKLRHCIRWRDFLETAVGVVMAVVFAATAWPMWIGGLEVSAMFAVWLALVCCFIPLRLARARSRFPARESDLPLRAFLGMERRALLHQRRLLSTVLWWYVGPIMIGVLGLFIGIRGLHWHSLAYGVVVLVIGYMIVRANRAAVRRQIEPALRTLDEQIRQLEENDAH